MFNKTDLVLLDESKVRRQASLKWALVSASYCGVNRRLGRRPIFPNLSFPKNIIILKRERSFVLLGKTKSVSCGGKILHLNVNLFLQFQRYTQKQKPWRWLSTSREESRRKNKWNETHTNFKTSAQRLNITPYPCSLKLQLLVWFDLHRVKYMVLI